VNLVVDTAISLERYRISLHHQRLSIEGGSGRALLYGVYDLLRRLGCRWPAPAFSFYHGSTTIIPRRDSLYVSISGTIDRAPVFAFRKLDVEEGRSHTSANLMKLVDWMAKAGFNTLQVPLNYGGAGRVEWDRWRTLLTPALEKRGLMIEVGGHGYQNFLNAGMEDSTLFIRHPSWFGRDKNCDPSPEEYEVFNTSDSGAVRYFIANIMAYLRSHPEIDIFDFWPPDGAHWDDCPGGDSMGTAEDRQARLANLVNAKIHEINPGIRLEIIAYAGALLPPDIVRLDPGILVDFCPIDQSYERQIYDSLSNQNRIYIKALNTWRKTFSGDIGLYSYYRKYAWHSLPNVIPHYIARDMKWYAGIPLQGISVYCEPGDWATYALNYYTLSRLAWNPDTNVDSLMGAFCHMLYGTQSETALLAYHALEHTVRRTGNIPFTTLKPPTELQDAQERLAKVNARLDSAIQASHGTSSIENLRKLGLAIDYAGQDLRILEFKQTDPALARQHIAAMVDFLTRHKDEGVFLLRTSDNLERYLRYYGFKR
jgi:hypothetical protein